MIAPELLARAGEIIRNGGLVAFPTETVYGLGANALDAVHESWSVQGFNRYLPRRNFTT